MPHCRARHALVVLAATVGLAVLGGCGTPAPEASPTTTPTTISTSPTPTRTPPPTRATPATRLPAGDPVRVVVTGTDGTEFVDAPLIPQGLDAEGVFAPPPGVVGWYSEKGWPKPGHPGASILAGHINSPQNGDDTFARLPEVTPGATISVTYDSGDTVEFEVTRSQAVPKARTPQDDSIWDAANPRPLIRLITCDPATPIEGGHYVGNWVLWGREST